MKKQNKDSINKDLKYGGCKVQQDRVVLSIDNMQVVVWKQADSHIIDVYTQDGTDLISTMQVFDEEVENVDNDDDSADDVQYYKNKGRLNYDD